MPSDSTSEVVKSNSPLSWAKTLVAKIANLPEIATEGPIKETSEAAVKRSKFKIDEYNWTGFQCPYCTATDFIGCTGHLICDGTVEQRKDGTFFRCFCGEAGSLGDSFVDTISSTTLAVEARTRKTSGDLASCERLTSSHVKPALPTKR
jgi:hypothetical protein